MKRHTAYLVPCLFVVSLLAASWSSALPALAASGNPGPGWSKANVVGGGCSGSGSCGSSLTPGSSTLFEYTPDRQRVSRTPSGYVGTSAPSPSLANHGGDTTKKSRQVCHVSAGDTTYYLGWSAGTWHHGASWTFLGYDSTGKARWDGPRNWHWAFEHNDSCSPPAGGLPTATPFGGPIGGLPTATPGGLLPTPDANIPDEPIPTSIPTPTPGGEQSCSGVMQNPTFSIWRPINPLTGAMLPYSASETHESRDVVIPPTESIPVLPTGLTSMLIKQTLKNYGTSGGSWDAQHLIIQPVINGVIVPNLWAAFNWRIKDDKTKFYFNGGKGLAEDPNAKGRPLPPSPYIWDLPQPGDLSSTITWANPLTPGLYAIHAETDDATWCRRRDVYFFFKVGSNVSMSKTAPATIKPGETLTYQLNYAVSGAAGVKVDTVVVRDTLPPDVTYISASPTPSSVSGTTLYWNLGSLTTGTRGTITLQVQVNIDTQLTSLSNTGIVSTSTPGDDPSDNSSTVTTQVIAVPDVMVQKTGPVYTLPNAMLTYRLHYANIGTRLAKNVRLVDTLPGGGVQFATSSPAPSGRSGQTLSWDLGDLPFGEAGDIMVTVQVTDDAPTSLTNRGTISTTTPGDNPNNNTSTVTTAVIRPPTIGADFKLQIHSTLDPQNGVYVSTGDTIAWPAGEVLDFTPKVTLNYAGSAPSDPFGYNVRVTAWRFVSSLGKDAESDPDSMAGSLAAHGDPRRGCRTREQPAADDVGALSGCVYKYYDTPSPEQMAGQAHIYWSVGLPQSMRSNVYVYDLGVLRPADLVLEVNIETEVVDRASGLVVYTQQDVRRGTFKVDMVVPRSVK